MTSPFSGKIEVLHPGRLAELDQLLISLNNPDAGSFLGLSITEGSKSRLLRGARGDVCVLIASQGKALGPNLKLRNVEAQVGVRCHVITPDGNTSDIEGVLISCSTSDPQLRLTFLSLMEDVLRALGPSPSTSDIAKWLHHIAALFSKLEQDGRKQLRGLWAELAVMTYLGNPELCVRRWHSDQNDRFDFNGDMFSIEVKSCQDLDRVHHFSLSQLNPAAELTVWLASILVRADPRGHSTLNLLSELESRISNVEVRSKLRLMVFAIGGRALEDDHIHRFDRETAINSVRLMDIRAVPSIPEPLPPEVRSVTLQVQCRDLPSVGDPSHALLRMS